MEEYISVACVRKKGKFVCEVKERDRKFEIEVGEDENVIGEEVLILIPSKYEDAVEEITRDLLLEEQS